MPNQGDDRNTSRFEVSDSATTSPGLDKDASAAAGASERLAGGNETAGAAPVSSIEKNLMHVAEELGAWLGTAERRTTDFLAQQKTITEHLVQIRDTAARLLAQVEKGRDRSR